MFGEFGAYNKKLHPLVVAWMRDYLDLWTAGDGLGDVEFNGVIRYH